MFLLEFVLLHSVKKRTTTKCTLIKHYRLLKVGKIVRIQQNLQQCSEYETVGRYNTVYEWSFIPPGDISGHLTLSADEFGIWDP